MILKKWVIPVELTTIFVCALMFQVDNIWSQVLLFYYIFNNCQINI